jgi:hypothetical protein
MRLLPLICTVLPVVQAFGFGLTGPNPDVPLNLSQPIQITWSRTEGHFDEPLARVVNLWFSVTGAESSGVSSWEIQSNLSISADSYTWDPSHIVRAMQSTGTVATRGKDHSIQARLADAKSSKLGTVWLEYAIDGGVESAGETVGVSKAMAGFVTGLAVLKGLLL